MIKSVVNISVLFFLLYQCNAFAQDTLYFTNNKTELVKVTEVGVKTISYYKYNNIEGPLYTIEKEKVKKIIYSNGIVEKSILNNIFELKFNKIQIVATDLVIPRITCNTSAYFLKDILGLKYHLCFLWRIILLLKPLLRDL